jgi:heme exporter protein D
MIIDRDTIRQPGLTVGLAVLPLVALIASEVWQVTGPDHYARILHEDRPVEFMQAICYVVSSLLSALIGSRLYSLSSRYLALLYALFAVILMVFAMEEISWGQRLLGLGTPNYFIVNNMQGETNLHNLDSIGFDGEYGFVVNTAIAVTVLYIAFAWTLASPRIFQNQTVNHYLVPSWYFGGYFLLPILWSAEVGGPAWISATLPHEHEFAETLYATGCLLFMILGIRRLKMVTPA